MLHRKWKALSLLAFIVLPIYFLVFLMLTKTPFRDDQSITIAKCTKIPANEINEFGFYLFSPSDYTRKRFILLFNAYTSRIPSAQMPLYLYICICIYMEFIKLIYFCCCWLFPFGIVGGIMLTKLNGSATGLSKYWWC